MDFCSPVLKLKNELRRMISQASEKFDILAMPLPEIDLLSGMSRFKKLSFGGTIQDFKFCLECATKDLLYEILQSTNFHPQPDGFDAATLQPLFQLIDIVLVLAETELCEQTLPLSIIEELLDAQTIGGSQCAFSYLESRFQRLTVGVDGSKGKGLFLLRLSNELLRRLSKSEDTVFCGRILVFLSKSFPLCERSGVNLRGEFNIDNKTNFEGIPADDERIGVELSGLGDFDPLSDVMKPQQFYPAFWSMQDNFSDPTRLFNDKCFQKFRKSLRLTLRAFKWIADQQTHHGASHLKAELRSLDKRHNTVGEDLDRYNPKYLTSRELFELEIRDLVFRRHVLVQAYILTEFLLTLSLDSKKKWESETKNRSVQYSFTLTDDDLRWANENKRDISIALHQEKGMDGLLFSRTVDSVLTREKNWVKWKADNCISFENPTLAANEIEKTKVQADTLSDESSILENSHVAAALSKIWIGDGHDSNIDDLKSHARYQVPDTRSFQGKADELELDMEFASNGAERDELMGIYSSITWRALRLASKDKFHIFNRLDDDLNLKSLVVVEE